MIKKKETISKIKNILVLINYMKPFNTKNWMLPKVVELNQSHVHIFVQVSCRCKYDTNKFGSGFACADNKW